VLAAWTVAQQSQKPVLSFLAVALSPAFLAVLGKGNVDGMLLICLSLPGAWKALLPLTKPQGSIGLLVVAWKRDRRGLLVLVCLLSLSSLVLWGLWPLCYPKTHLAGAYGWRSDWWLGSLMGLAMLMLAWKRNSTSLALTASVFLSPYLNCYSVLPALAAWAVEEPEATKKAIPLWWAALIFMAIHNCPQGP